MRYRLGETDVGFRSTLYRVGRRAENGTYTRFNSCRIGRVRANNTRILHRGNGTRVPPDNGGNSKG